MVGNFTIQDRLSKAVDEGGGADGVPQTLTPPEYLGEGETGTRKLMMASQFTAGTTNYCKTRTSYQDIAPRVA